MKLKATQIGIMSALMCTVLLQNVNALDWQDNSVGVTWGNKYREPNNPRDVTKTTVNFTHISGDRFGTNLFVAEMLFSTKSDPSRNGDGAREVYALYKRAFSLSALTGYKLGNSVFKDWFLNARFDIGRKDSAVETRPKKVRVGISTTFAIPKGNLSLGVDAYHNRTHNRLTVGNFSFKTTYAIWGGMNIPVSSKGAIEGMFDHIGRQGKDGFGNETKPMTIVRLGYMHEISKGLKAGVSYQYFRNKYGSDNRRDPRKGSTENAYMLQLRYHF